MGSADAGIEDVVRDQWVGRGQIAGKCASTMRGFVRQKASVGGPFDPKGPFLQHERVEYDPGMLQIRGPSAEFGRHRREKPASTMRGLHIQ